MAIYDYKKQFKGNRLVGVENRGCNVEYGEYGLIASGYSFITEKQFKHLLLAA